MYNRYFRDFGPALTRMQDEGVRTLQRLEQQGREQIDELSRRSS
jgi:hypothetical protein